MAADVSTSLPTPGFNFDDCLRNPGKRPLDSELDIGETKRSHQGGANGTYHFKILIPSIAAGAIIGKGGETIAQLQQEAGAKVRMSKARDFYPGTTERVCLITGTVEGILRIHEFIMEKIKEKPDPNAKMAIDFDHKQPVEREKQVKILVPNSTAGMILGKGGSYIKQIKEESGAYIQISQKSKDQALAERCITVIGEMDNNKTACRMIISKIVEDPQSGSCLNISYADVTGPVANFNPTGSPFASSVSSAMNDSNISCSSNDSLNTLSPTVTSNFSNSQTSATHIGMTPFHGHANPEIVPPTHAAQAIESFKLMLRGNGFSEQAVSEVSAAMNTLARYGVFGMLNSINATILGGLGIRMPNSAANNCQMPLGGLSSQGLYNCAAGVPNIETACNSISSGSLRAESNMFSPIGSLGNEMSGLGLGPRYSSPTSHSSDPFLMQAETAMFEPCHRTSPALASPSAAALPVNNSFGLGTSLGAGSPNLGKSPSDLQFEEVTKIEIEIDENIVGAILGPGGKTLMEIQRFSGANIQISEKGEFAPGTHNRIVTISGLSTAVNTAQYLIECQISKEEAKRAKQNVMGVLR